VGVRVAVSSHAAWSFHHRCHASQGGITFVWSIDFGRSLDHCFSIQLTAHAWLSEACQEASAICSASVCTERRDIIIFTLGYGAKASSAAAVSSGVPAGRGSSSSAACHSSYRPETPHHQDPQDQDQAAWCSADSQR
jgi:shikimate kinase